MAKEKVDRTTYSVSDFLSWQKLGTLSLNPDFQRRPVWKKGAKSYLIDTILRGFPTPVIFLRELPADLNTLESKREVVDGQQRLRTLLGFVSSSCLSDYDPERDEFTLSRTHNADLAGRAFKELPKDARQTILDYRFGVHVFSSEVGDREVLQIFARMNATGVRLNDQELRNAEYYGEFKTTAFELAAEQLDRWRKWGIFTAYNIARMDEVELSSELMIQIIEGISEKSKTVIDAAYIKLDEDFPGRDEVAKRFRAVFESIGTLMTDADRHLFHKRTLFYCLFAALYDHLYGLRSGLKSVKAKTVSMATLTRLRECGTKITKGTAPKAVLDSTTRRTSHARERRAIVGYLLDKNL